MINSGGIPCKAMNIDRLHKRLTDLGVDFPKPTLKRLGYQDLISRPVPAKPEEREPGKKGKEASWKEDAVGEAAAVWAIKKALGNKNLPSKKKIDAIKKAVNLVYVTPFPYCRITRQGAGTPGGIGGMELEDEIEIKFVSEKFEDLALFPGRDKREQSDHLDELVIAWVCAKEKAKQGISMLIPKRVVFHWWQNLGPVVRIDSPITLRRITVEDAEHNEIVPYWNEMDVYQMMPLFIGGSEAYQRWQDMAPR